MKLSDFRKMKITELKEYIKSNRPKGQIKNFQINGKNRNELINTAVTLAKKIKNMEKQKTLKRIDILENKVGRRLKKGDLQQIEEQQQQLWDAHAKLRTDLLEGTNELYNVLKSKIKNNKNTIFDKYDDMIQLLDVLDKDIIDKFNKRDKDIQGIKSIIMSKNDIHNYIQNVLNEVNINSKNIKKLEKDLTLLINGIKSDLEFVGEHNSNEIKKLDSSKVDKNELVAVYKEIEKKYKGLTSDLEFVGESINKELNKKADILSKKDEKIDGNIIVLDNKYGIYISEIDRKMKEYDKLFKEYNKYFKTLDKNIQNIDNKYGMYISEIDKILKKLS